MDVNAFLEKFSCWVKEQPDIEGAALIGSYASGLATENSDVDLMILTTNATVTSIIINGCQFSAKSHVRKMRRGVWWKQFALSIKRA